jgi:uncharacterized membrane protein
MKAAVARFFDAEIPDEERKALLEEYDVAYLFYGPDERALGAFDPEGSRYLVQRFSQDGVRVYAVSMP